MENMMGYSAVLFAAFAIFFVVAVGVGILFWSIVPFSVFGVKGLMKKVVKEQEETNRLLKSLLEAGYRRESLFGEVDEFGEKREKTH